MAPPIYDLDPTFKVKLNGHEMSFPIPHSSGQTLQDNHEIAEIRRFLKQCGLAPASTH